MGNNVKRFRVGNGIKPFNDVEIEERNARYRAYKRDKENAEKLHTVTEAAYTAKQASTADTNRARIPLALHGMANQYLKTMPEIILREYFTALVTNSLVWDQDAITENMQGIRYGCHKYISAIGGMNAVKEAAIKNKSVYLEHLYNVCMEAGKKVAKHKTEKLKKKIKPENVQDQKIDFVIDTADQDDINKKIKDLDIDNLSEMVKDKVLDVVKDEQECQEKDDAFIQDLKTSIQTLNGQTDLSAEDNDTPADNTNANGDTPDNDGADYGQGVDDTEADTAAEGTTESFAKYAYKGKVDVLPSLFRSMVVRSMKTALKEHMVREGTSHTMTAKRNGEDDDPLENTIRNQPTNLNIYDIYLNDGGEDLSYIDFVKNSDENAIAGDDTSIDNDEVLAEAIGMYTILECANTIKLITPDEKGIKLAIHINQKR